MFKVWADSSFLGPGFLPVLVYLPLYEGNSTTALNEEKVAQRDANCVAGTGDDKIPGKLQVQPHLMPNPFPSLCTLAYDFTVTASVSPTEELGKLRCGRVFGLPLISFRDPLIGPLQQNEGPADCEMLTQRPEL